MPGIEGRFTHFRIFATHDKMVNIAEHIGVKATVAILDDTYEIDEQLGEQQGEVLEQSIGDVLEQAWQQHLERITDEGEL